MKRFFILFFLAFGLASCVSLKSYRETKARMLVLEYEKAPQTKTHMPADTLQNSNNQINEQI